MKCPHCTKKVSIFSKSMFSFDKDKKCPHCKKAIKSYINLKIAGLLFIPFILISFYILKPFLIAFGISGSYSTGLLGGALVLISMRLKSTELSDHSNDTE